MLVNFTTRSPSSAEHIISIFKDHQHHNDQEYIPYKGVSFSKCGFTPNVTAKYVEHCHENGHWKNTLAVLDEYHQSRNVGDAIHKFCIG